MKYFLVDDEETGKALYFKANSMEEAVSMSEGVNFDDYEDGDDYN